jgi:uncharacterized protein
MHSSVYEGLVTHNRYSPIKHVFTYTLFMLYLDLDELESLFQKRVLWSTRWPTIGWFRRQDFMGGTDTSLSDSVREKVLNEMGVYPTGPIRLLTQLRYFGFFMNPVCFYYCFDEAGEKVISVVAEVTNTPWGEKHIYVWPGHEIGCVPGSEKSLFPKEMHVSPFMPMDQKYRCSMKVPGSVLQARVQNIEEEELVFEATLALKKKSLNTKNLLSALLNYPFMSLKIVGGIYYQAYRLWRKGLTFHSHPKHPTKTRSIYDHD